MLTGRHLFAADTIPETLAHVMTRAADLGTLPDTMPRRVRDLVARCLEKDPKKRLRDIGEARLIPEGPTVLDPDVAPLSFATAVAAPLAPFRRRADCSRASAPSRRRIWCKCLHFVWSE
jgi:serine/threonine protein kinase